MTSYDMSKPRQRTGLHRTVLREGLNDDLSHRLNQDLLRPLWPQLHTRLLTEVIARGSPYSSRRRADHGRGACVSWRRQSPTGA